MTKESTWSVLSKIDSSQKIEKKNGLSYLSWAWAWGIVKQHYPSANYKVIHYDGKPYLCDAMLGYMVATEVMIDGETIPMQLPVMDGANKAQKSAPYTYKTKYGDKSVEAATMFDINTAIMRCLTKNLAMFGLGHYIYAGEDLPVSYDTESIPATPNVKANIKQPPADLVQRISSMVANINSVEDFELIKDLPDYQYAKKYPSLKTVLIAKYNSVKS